VGQCTRPCRMGSAARPSPSGSESEGRGRTSVRTARGPRSQSTPCFACSRFRALARSGQSPPGMSLVRRPPEPRASRAPWRTFDAAPRCRASGWPLPGFWSGRSPSGGPSGWARAWPTWASGSPKRAWWISRTACLLPRHNGPQQDSAAGMHSAHRCACRLDKDRVFLALAGPEV
jgi:hypothetical protein